MNIATTKRSQSIGEAAYFEQRLDDQINWYDDKSSLNKNRYSRLRLLEIIFAAMIPLLAGYARESEYLGYAIGLLGMLVAVIAGVIGLYRFQENWIEYRAQAESLKQEKYLYLTRATPYDNEGAFELLVQRVEALLKRETTGWAQSLRAVATAENEKDSSSGPPSVDQ